MSDEICERCYDKLYAYLELLRLEDDDVTEETEIQNLLDELENLLE